MAGAGHNTATKSCPAGTQVVSVGFSWDLNDDDLGVVKAQVLPGSDSVSVTGVDSSGLVRQLTAHAYCIKA